MDSHRTASPRRSADHPGRSSDQRPAYTPEQLAARAAADSKRAAMHRRVRRIRRYVAGLAASLFSAAFLVVYVQLASGHDPALSAALRKSTAASASSAKTSKASSTGSTESTGTTESTNSTGSTESTGTTESTNSTESSGSAQSSGSASAVTTSQS
jgi:hypothetical protein